VKGYLLDANHVVYWQDKRRPQHTAVERHIQTLPEGTPLRISSITLGEIEYGRRVASECITAEQQVLFEFITRYLPIALEIKNTTRMEYGRLRACLFENFAPLKKRRKSLRPEQLIDPVTALELRIQENDIWLAAQALEYNLVFATNDGNIQRIRDVYTEFQVENWAI